MTRHDPDHRSASAADSLQQRAADAAVAEYIHELSDRHRPSDSEDEQPELD